MKVDHDDGEIRERFQRLKLEDEKLARPFSAYRDTPRRHAGAGARDKLRYSRSTRVRLSPRLAALTLALALLAGFAVMMWTQTRPPWSHPEVSIAQLSRWRAPTDSLLRTPENQLLRTVPRFNQPLSGNNPFGGSETR